MGGNPGVRLLEGARGEVGNIDDEGGSPLDPSCKAMTLRINVRSQCRLVASIH